MEKNRTNSLEPKLLEINDLSVQFTVNQSTVKAVNHLSLQIGHGECVGLVGETGAGKTTTALAVMQLVPDPPGKIVSGSICFEGENLLEISRKKMRGIRGSSISMIFQDPMTSLNPILRVGDQIMETILLHEKISKAEAVVKAQKMLEMVGIPAERYDEYPHQFSGGMKQRVMIACALVCNPKLLIADEPTTALDVSIQAQILNLMQDLQQERQLTYMFITHNLSVVKHISDTINVMYLGTLVETTSAKELFRHQYNPYTKALISAIPGIKREKKRARILLKGEITSPIDPPDACRFASQCVYAKEACFRSCSKLTEVSKDHFVAYHFTKEINGL